MIRRLMIAMTAAVSLTAGAAGADSGIPYVGSIDYAPAEAPTLLLVPDGSGALFSEARDAAGLIVDARVTVWLVDRNFAPIVNFPREDVWLQFAVAPGIVVGCRNSVPFPGGMFGSDVDSDVDGRMHFELPAHGGGWSAGPVWVYLNGWVAFDPAGVEFAPLPLQINSPDLNGDLTVNLSDVPPFAADFFGAFHLRSDLYRDGELNLSDLVVLAEHMGAACP